VLVTAHLGRPKGAPEEKYSLRPAVTRLAELAGFKVSLAGDTVGSSAKEAAASLQDGEVLVLENVRFDARETSKDDAERGAFADELVALTGDNGAYVDDAFGAVHRKHASVYDVATRLPSYLGDLVHTEVEVLRRLTTDTQRPYVVVLGGSKVSDKLAVIDNLLGKADTILVGGGMLFTFLAAAGHKVASSLLEEDQIPVVQDYLTWWWRRSSPLTPRTRQLPRTRSKAAASEPRASAWTSDLTRRLLSPSGSRVPKPSSGTAPWVSSSSRRSRPVPVPSPRP
jgi:phosphoglycerate kinase